MEEEQPTTTKHHSGMTIGGVALMVIGILLFIIAIGILIYDRNQSIQATWWVYLLAIVGSLMLIMASVLFIMAHSQKKKAEKIEQPYGIQKGEEEHSPFVVTTPEQSSTVTSNSPTHTLITTDPQGRQISQNLQSMPQSSITTPSFSQQSMQSSIAPPTFPPQPQQVDLV